MNIFGEFSTTYTCDRTRTDGGQIKHERDRSTSVQSKVSTEAERKIKARSIFLRTGREGQTLDSATESKVLYITKEPAYRFDIMPIKLNYRFGKISNANLTPMVNIIKH